MMALRATLTTHLSRLDSHVPKAVRKTPNSTPGNRRPITIIVALIGAAALISMLTTAPPSAASTYGFEINGTYRVTSDGEWAKTNDVYIDQLTVNQIWTIESSCSDRQQCDGKVLSDQGWTAPVRYRTDRWSVEREHLNWAPCPNGPAAKGFQRYSFYNVGPTGLADDTHADTLTGNDSTHTVSGACGRSQPIVITMPLLLIRIG